LDADDRCAIGPLRERGYAVEPAVWDDPAVDWSRFGLVVLRSPWDYARRRDEFWRWARGVPRLANDAATVGWNTDKRYLAELADAGVPIVPTRWITAAADAALPDHGAWVIKPAIGAGSLDTGRYRLSDPAERALADHHIARLRAAGRLTMVQPYLPAIDEQGETALVFVGGTYSHAIRKGPMLAGPSGGATHGSGLYKVEEIAAREATPAERDLAERTLAALPGRPDLLYARVDLVPGPDGRPLLIELELTEPSLFLGYAAGAADRFADAIAARAGA
jgi:hypothetical protein